ncbi:hypothetical protein Taro_041542 [Colocasia esculenta]|uniref:CCHC-type domain-containing protein n=1 Tax=Colocasia esculenta TaxID=4460 RepID=A0A843WBQ7_COLES|nr:hypothetical protein [Colocasia esculenta]
MESRGREKHHLRQLGNFPYLKISFVCRQVWVHLSTGSNSFANARSQAMASRGRCGAQAREDEQRREERDEQQAPTPQGPTSQAPALVPQEHGHGGPSIMERFKRMAPPSFKGESQPLFAESWMREVEKIFRAITCAEEDKVSLATYMLQALSVACRHESDMDQYIEEKRAAQKRSAPPFQRQDNKKAVVYKSPQRPVASSQQVVVPQSPSFKPSDKKMCRHCGRAHDGTECWKLVGKCLKCGSTEHQIYDCPRLQQFAQRGAPTPAVATPMIGRPEGLGPNPECLH